MKLYDSEWAPSPRRVRIFLAEKGIVLERLMVDLRGGGQLAPEYLAVNPRGTVPALRLDSGEVIGESAAICRYLEALHPDPPLFGASAVEIGRIEDWTRRVEQDGYAAVVYAFRNARPAMEGHGVPGKWPPMPLIPELAARGAIMWGAFIEALDSRLGESAWIAGDLFSFADITALVTIDFARSARLAVPDGLTHVARWYDAATARPSAGA